MRRYFQSYLFLVWMLANAACGSAAELPQEATGTRIVALVASTASVSPSPESIEVNEATASETACFLLLRPKSASEAPNIGLVSFEWDDAIGASKYQLQLELPNGNFEFFNSEAASLDKYMESFPLAGTYSWRVLAFDSGGKPICFSDRFVFSKTQYEAEP